MSAAATTPSNPQTPTADPAAADPQQSAAASDLDVVKLLVVGGDEDGAAAAQPTEEAPATAKDGDAGADEPEGQATQTGEGEGTQAAADNKPPTGEPQQPGTPDKALQKLQQDFAAQSRKVEELMAKLDGGQTLTAKEQQQAQTAKRKLDAIREAIQAKGADFDVLQHDQDIAASLIEHDDELTALKAEQAETRRQLAELRKEREAQAEQAVWAAAQQQFPGVAVQQVWGKAVADAYAQIGVADAAKLAPDSPLHAAAENVANHLFATRADAAAKAVKAKAGATVGAPKAPQAPRAAADPTPNGARVSQPTGLSHPTGEASDDAKYEQLALSLVK